MSYVYDRSKYKQFRLSKKDHKKLLPQRLISWKNK